MTDTPDVVLAWIARDFRCDPTPDRGVWIGRLTGVAGGPTRRYRRRMLFTEDVWAGLADGTVTMAFRRWKRPTVKAGGTLQSPGGLLGIDTVEVVGDDAITDESARTAGRADRADLLAALVPDEPGRQLYRVTFHRLGDDPRIALRADDRLSPA